MLGLKRGTVELLPHQLTWEEIAKDTISLLKSLLGDAAIDIQHVGSTAIRNICAKPISDIAVGVDTLDSIMPYIGLLEQDGIIFRKEDVKEQLLFVMGDFKRDTRTHHIHVVKWNSIAWNNYINFRDYLNTFPEHAKEYEALKKELLIKFAHDRGRYTAGKQEMIDSLLKQACSWRMIQGVNDEREIFDEQCQALFRDIGEHKKMVLSTSFEGCVTSRMMSVVIFDDIFYFQTDMTFRKYAQLKKNEKAALCIDNLQIEGLCRELGHPACNPTFSSLYEKHFPSAFKRYTYLANERLFSFKPTYIKRWIYEEGEPYEEIFDFTHRLYEKRKYIAKDFEEEY